MPRLTPPACLPPRDARVGAGRAMSIARELRPLRVDHGAPSRDSWRPARSAKGWARRCEARRSCDRDGALQRVHAFHEKRLERLATSLRSDRPRAPPSRRFATASMAGHARALVGLRGRGAAAVLSADCTSSTCSAWSTHPSGGEDSADRSPRASLAERSPGAARAASVARAARQVAIRRSAATSERTISLAAFRPDAGEDERYHRHAERMPTKRSQPGHVGGRLYPGAPRDRTKAICTPTHEVRSPPMATHAAGAVIAATSEEPRDRGHVRHDEDDRARPGPGDRGARQAQRSFSDRRAGAAERHDRASDHAGVDAVPVEGGIGDAARHRREAWPSARTARSAGSSTRRA